MPSWFVIFECCIIGLYRSLRLKYFKTKQKENQTTWNENFRKESEIYFDFRVKRAINFSPTSDLCLELCRPLISYSRYKLSTLHQFFNTNFCPPTEWQKMSGLNLVLVNTTQALYNSQWARQVELATLKAASHTRAKSRDQEIVRAQKKVSQARPNKPPKSCSVVTDPQV